MYFKTIIPLLLLLWGSTTADNRLIDKILAVVDGEIITLSDVSKAAKLNPSIRTASESEKDFRARILENLINYKVVYQEFEQEFQLEEEDFEEIQILMINKAGSMEMLTVTLKNLGMGWPDLKDFIREKVVYEKILKEKVFTKITIPFVDIEKFYKEEYLPAQQQLQLRANTLIEMTPIIEKHLRKLRTESRLQEWLSEIKAGHEIKYPPTWEETAPTHTGESRTGE